MCREGGNDKLSEDQRAGYRRRFLPARLDTAESHRCKYKDTLSEQIIRIIRKEASSILLILYTCLVHIKEKVSSAVTPGQHPMETTLNHNAPNETFPINASND